jgi:hypothetical protein
VLLLADRADDRAPYLLADGGDRAWYADFAYRDVLLDQVVPFQWSK